MTAEETQKEKFLKRNIPQSNGRYYWKSETLMAMEKFAEQALTTYRTDVLSAIERGEDIMKLDLNQYNK